MNNESCLVMSLFKVRKSKLLCRGPSRQATSARPHLRSQKLLPQFSLTIPEKKLEPIWPYAKQDGPDGREGSSAIDRNMESKSWAGGSGTCVFVDWIVFDTGKSRSEN